MGSIKNKLLILARDSDSYARIIRDNGIEGLEVHAANTLEAAGRYLDGI